MHSVWDLWRSGLQECKGKGQLEDERRGQKFSGDPENPGFFVGQLPLPVSTSPRKARRG